MLYVKEKIDFLTSDNSLINLDFVKTIQDEFLRTSSEEV